MGKTRNGILLMAVAGVMNVVGSLLTRAPGAGHSVILAGLAFLLSLASVGIFALGLLRLFTK